MDLNTGLDGLTELRDEKSRAITAENPEGKPGAGGKAASNLGPGRKGRPNIPIDAGETATVADVDGPGVIKHVWITVPNELHGRDHLIRDLVLRMYWDGEDEPSVEVPLGDFFCQGHGRFCNVNSRPVAVGSNGGMNTYLPMPFRERALITVENQSPVDIDGPKFFYQIDYSLVDEIEDGTPYLHAQWRRSNPVTPGEDHVIVDGIEGEGHYAGTHLSWTALGQHWWGEGEVKFYVDGDDEYPTICGTGAEDYVGGAWAFGDNETFSTPYLGYPQYHDGDDEVPKHGLYRWHVPDPIRFREDLRATAQAIGHRGELFERSDDVASVAYWYQREPHSAFPELPDAEERRPR
jgi:hypothetical protein